MNFIRESRLLLALRILALGPWLTWCGIGPLTILRSGSFYSILSSMAFLLWLQHLQLLEQLAVQQQLCLCRPTLYKKLPWMHLTIDSWLHTALQSLPTNSMLRWAFALLATTFPSGGTLADSVILHNKVMSGVLEFDFDLTLELSLVCLAHFSFWHGRTWNFVTTWASGLHSKNTEPFRCSEGLSALQRALLSWVLRQS